MLSTASRIQDRRAIEALRSGVPNGDAVRALGSTQPRIGERFRQQLRTAEESFPAGKQAAGLLISGDFGSGKSHTLEYLKHLALQDNFVCSKIVVSKETPLHDPAKLYRAAIQSAVVPGKRGSALTEIVEGFGPRSEGYPELLASVKRREVGLGAIFAATLFVFGETLDPDIKNRIVSFWAGDPIRLGELRSWLRVHGESVAYNLETITARDLALQRFRFTPRLMVAAGYSGWVLLIDEVELIGRYSFRQRARSYAELARWMGKLEGDSFPGLTAVLAITSDFARAVLEERNDEEAIPGRLRAREFAPDKLLASQAERGMRLIAREAMRLQPLEKQAIERTRELVREIHAQAYQWNPPPLDEEQRLTTTSMRQYVRRWITEWDLKWLDPDYAANMITSDLVVDYRENPDLEVSSEGDGDRGSEAGGLLA